MRILSLSLPICYVKFGIRQADSQASNQMREALLPNQAPAYGDDNSLLHILEVICRKTGVSGSQEVNS
jgi:hypothetical protein